jgi:hypothetical protein
MVAATLLLAVIAAAVGVLAYTVSTGAPALRIRVESVSSGTSTSSPGDQGQIRTVSFEKLTVKIYLRNDNQYPARSPAVVVRLNGLLAERCGAQEWAVTGFEEAGLTEAQWDGGASYSVHGHSRRRLPDLSLSRLVTFWEDPGFEFEILADGYRRTVAFDAGFMMREDFSKWGYSGEWI